MAKMVGGPAHGKTIQGVMTEWFSIPVFNNNRAPKEIRRSGIRFLSCRYRRTRLTRDGERLYKFISGYYP
jgi:hypothetical protein